jgi:hypothetical protein
MFLKVKELKKKNSTFNQMRAKVSERIEKKRQGKKELSFLN